MIHWAIPLGLMISNGSKALIIKDESTKEVIFFGLGHTVSTGAATEDEGRPLIGYSSSCFWMLLLQLKWVPDLIKQTI